ncbi:hypothetical protein [Ruegeria halocynthiae]|uniref:hypothetical protein n=1 Tax=Ruegeria halocynthiae TaxID=985054 RepID=UPI0009DFB5F2|nr:hypothetical protein [Ruegeria halocynthiae]
MAHLTSAPRIAIIRPEFLAAILLTGVIGFALGQNWPSQGVTPPDASVAASEDWHGNVRRSHWAN